MTEATGDLFACPADVRVIPTNGQLRRDGRLVMGAGVAKAAAALDPTLAFTLGRRLSEYGNKPALVGRGDGLGFWLSWPTKRHWRDASDLALILAGAPDVLRLIGLVDAAFRRRSVVVLPRLGCGLGQLAWAAVGPALAAVLDDRFTVLTPEAA